MLSERRGEPAGWEAPAEAAGRGDGDAPGVCGEEADEDGTGMGRAGVVGSPGET